MATDRKASDKASADLVLTARCHFVGVSGEPDTGIALTGLVADNWVVCDDLSALLPLGAAGCADRGAGRCHGTGRGGLAWCGGAGKMDGP